MTPIRDRGSLVCVHSTDVFHWSIAYGQLLLSRKRKLPTSNGTGNKYSFIALWCALAIFAAPAGVYAQLTANDDPMENCSIYGAQSMSVGSIATLGGGVVPVSDAAVTLNTGMLVYKECIVRKIIDAKKKAAIAQLISDSSKTYLKGREVCTVDIDGNRTCETTSPYFPEDLAADQRLWESNVVNQNISGGLSNSLNPAYQNDLRLALNRSYQQQIQNPGASLACSYTGDLVALNNGAYDGPQSLFAVGDPNCNPLFNYYNYQSSVMSIAAADTANRMTRLGWNNGTYDVEYRDPATGRVRVVTPGFIVAGTFQQQLGSNFRQLENANDIGQLINVFFAGIGNLAISATAQGLNALINSSVGTSFVDRMVQDFGAEQSAAQTGAALQNLQAAVYNESQYLAAKNATKDVLMQAATSLRDAENLCWSRIVPLVTTYAQQNSIAQIQIATTSEQWAQKVIENNNNSLVRLAASLNTEATAASTALDRLNEISAGVTNNTISGTDGYNQLNAIVSTLPTQADVQGAQEQTQTMQTNLGTLVQGTLTAWQGNADPTVGWCNVNTPAVIKGWADKWSGSSSIYDHR
ncbi:MAG: hypothetical protein Q7S01_03020 [bacterium]|nr:hypothetical protein [bacterium]